MMKVFLTWSLLFGSANVTASSGKTECPCWFEFPTTTFQWKRGSATGSYSSDYGKGCIDHDKDTQPYCTGSNPPSFCFQMFCFVDLSNCRNTAIGRSQFFTTSNQLYYSYDTCGSSDTWTTWQSGGSSIRQLHYQVDQNLIILRDQMEAEALTTRGSNGDCNGPDLLCQNRQGSQHGGYGEEVDFALAGQYLNSKETSSHNSAKCLFDAADDPMVRMGNLEQDSDGTKVAEIYAGDQAGGNYVQWPNAERCYSNGWDARLRPWYSAGLTTPKDVMIVVDVSGSMSQKSRSALAKTAVKAILKTLTFKDFLNIVLFNDGVAAVYNDIAFPCSEENLKEVETWVNGNSPSWNSGGTNFGAAFEATFDNFLASRKAGATSRCQKVVLFLTDGEDPQFTDFASVQKRAAETGMAIFTYALGSGADSTVTKQLACDNKGIFYQVDDGADLGTIMANYYEYFTKGQQICSSSGTRYAHAASNSEVYSSCMPMYNESAPKDGLYHPLGVACYDYNLIKDIASLKREADWEEFVCQVSDISKKCVTLDYTECHLQKLRSAVGADSVCSFTPAINPQGTDDCVCSDPACKDNDDYIDGFGFFCDSWVGDNCDTIQADFPEYNKATADAIRSQCARSCGTCPMSRSYCDQRVSCPEEGASSTRKCRGCESPKTISGIGLDGQPMCCPGETPATCTWVGLGPRGGGGGGSNSNETNDCAGPHFLVSLLFATTAALFQ